MKEEFISRIEYNISQLEDEIKNKELEFKNSYMGNGAIDLIMQVENLKGQIKAYKEMKLYLKY
ncbi:hypothetical protein [uncultured Clostridium sp.]|uniref:hypothetical protein n=1 Tax=uncultured Clostridium sp. TaxID=59620 RepID=UPI0025EACC9E|nr:hypothetical protein [uncultured Clostridium sp.]